MGDGAASETVVVTRNPARTGQSIWHVAAHVRSVRCTSAAQDLVDQPIDPAAETLRRPALIRRRTDRGRPGLGELGERQPDGRASGAGGRMFGGEQRVASSAAAEPDVGEVLDAVTASGWL